MGFAATTIWEIQQAGNDTGGGGGFDPGSANFATDLAATGATGSGPVVTSASYNFIARDVGAWLFVKSGTNWTPGWYQIASVAANAATLTASVGAAPLWDSSSGPYAMNATAGCATTASPTGGTWSIDYSQSASPAQGYTDIVIDGTTNTKATSAGHPFGPNFVGNVFSITAGTGFSVQRVQMVSVSGSTATFDKSLGTLSSTGGIGGCGGAMATLGATCALAVATNQIFMKYSATPYTVSSTSNNVANGKATLPGGTGTGALAQTYLTGYDAHRTLLNTDANRPILRAAVNSATIITWGQNYGRLANLLIDNPSAFTSCTAMNMAWGLWQIVNVKIDSYSSAFFQQDTPFELINCYSSNNTSGFPGSGSCLYLGCVSNGDSIAFGSIGNLSQVIDCVCIGATSSARDAFEASGHAMTTLINCTAYNNAGSGFQVGPNCQAINCLSVNNGHHGFNQNGTYAPTGWVYNCASYNNTSGHTNDFKAYNKIGFITLTADPFTNAGSSDFTLNSTAGGGALLKGLGFPTTLPGLTPTNYPSVGAYQPAAAAAGGLLVHPGLSGGARG